MTLPHLVHTYSAFAPVLAGSAALTSNRLPTPSHLADRYASVSGRDLGSLSFYLWLGYFKIAIIVEGSHARRTLPKAGLSRSAPRVCTKLIVRRCGRGLAWAR
jgi:aminoglycoside phosphotransferase (APT) family kinase protein